jgi:hypothetical protein
MFSALFWHDAWQVGAKNLAHSGHWQVIQAQGKDQQADGQHDRAAMLFS